MYIFTVIFRVTVHHCFKHRCRNQEIDSCLCTKKYYIKTVNATNRINLFRYNKINIILPLCCKHKWSINCRHCVSAFVVYFLTNNETYGHKNIKYNAITQIRHSILLRASFLDIPPACNMMS